MRRDIYTLRATGMTLADVGEWDHSILIVRLIWWLENYVEAAKVKGFPIIVNDETRTLAGYIGSQQLHHAIGELRFTCSNASHSLTVWTKTKPDEYVTYHLIPSALSAQIRRSNRMQGGRRLVRTRTRRQMLCMPLPPPGL